MIITMTLRRTRSQHARATLYRWAVGEGTRVLCAVEWDPMGPLDARTASMEALELMLAHLRAVGHEIALEVPQLHEDVSADATAS